MAIVAVEITPNQVLVAAAQKATGARLRLNYAGGVAIDADQDTQTIGQQLKELVDANGWTRSDTVVVVSRSEGELREISLPPSPDDELPDMVRFKAKSDFASFNDRWLLDFVTLDSDATQSRRVLASAIPPEVADRAREIVEAAGLRLKRLVLRPFATVECLGKELQDGSSLIIHPGDGNTDLIVANGTRPVSTRTIRSNGSQTPEAQNQQLISEVRRTLASLKRQPGVGEISKVILVDDPSTNKHLAGNLNQRLGLAVTSVDPFSNIDTHKSVGQGDFAEPRRWQYASLVGGLQDFADDRSPAIDFLNPTRPPEVKTDRSRYWLYGGVAGLATLFAIGFAWWTLRSQAAEKSKLTADLKVATEANDAEGVRPSVDQILARTDKIDQWKRNDINWLEELDQFSRNFLTADEAMVETMNFRLRKSKPQIEVTFRAASEEIESAATKELEKRPYLVDPSQSRKLADKDYPVSLDAVVTFVDDDNQWRKALDDKARAFIQGGSEPVTSDDGDVDGEPVSGEAE